MMFNLTFIIVVKQNYRSYDSCDDMSVKSIISPNLQKTYKLNEI